MIERVASFIERHRMFASGRRVGVAVSGGADSVCLLETLLELAPRWNLRLTVLHLDHGLRGEESREDARFAARLAARHGLPFELGEAHLAGPAGNGVNLEEAAREARRGFFLEQLGRGAIDRVALGHTRSDQAETVLFRLLRGTGPRGLAAMAPLRADGIVRPLLCVSREEVREHLRARGIAWREDSSNLDPRFARNRIRHQLLPALAREWNPEFEAALARLAAVMRDEEDWWENELGRLAPAFFSGSPPEVILDAARLTALHPAAARRLVRRALDTVRAGAPPLGFEHVEQVLELALRPAGDGRLMLPGADVMRSFDWIRLAPPAPAGAGRPDYSVAVRAPGPVAIPGAGRTLLVEPEEKGQPLPAALEIRNWRPGDAYQPTGRREPVKLKTLFQEARIPLWERRGWPVLSAGGRIVWAKRFGTAAGSPLKVLELADNPKTSNPGPCM